MENQLAYEFDSSQTADRFLNRLKSGAIFGVRAKRFKGSKSILVSYVVDGSSDFDGTCQQLDDLSAALDGREISIT